MNLNVFSGYAYHRKFFKFENAPSIILWASKRDDLVWQFHNLCANFWFVQLLGSGTLVPFFSNFNPNLVFNDTPLHRYTARLLPPFNTVALPQCSNASQRPTSSKRNYNKEDEHCSSIVKEHNSSCKSTGSQEPRQTLVKLRR